MPATQPVPKPTPPTVVAQPQNPTPPPLQDKPKRWMLVVGVVITVALIALGLLLLLPPTKTTNTTTAPTAKSTADVLVVTGDYPPFVYENRADHGVMPAIISAVFKKMNVNYTLKFYPWTRDEELIAGGQAFAAFPYSTTPERQQKYNFSDSFLLLGKVKVFYYKKFHPNPTLKSLSDLKTGKVGALAGYYYINLLKQNNIPYETVDNEETGIRQLIAGRTDYIPFNADLFNETVKTKFPGEENNFGSVELDLVQKGQDEAHMLVSRQYKDSDALLKQFNTALKQIIADGTYAKILTDHNMLPDSIIGR